MDANLPNHPFVPFRQLFKNIAEKHIPSTLGRWLFLFLCRLWYTLTGVAKPEKRIQESFASGENGYYSQYKRFASLCSPEFSASCVLQDEEPHEPPVKKATKLIVGALRFRARLASNTFQTELEGNRPLDMQRYSLVFSRITVASLQNGQPAFELVEQPPSEHVIVAIDGLFYKLRVIRDSQIVPTAAVYAQVSAILQDARQQLGRADSDRFPFGFFTALHDKETIPLFAALRERCPDTVQAIDSALFLLAIDIHDSPSSLEKLGRVIHVQNLHNRDYRRSMQLVLTGNGRAGLIADPVAGIGGGFMPRFLDDLAKQSPILEQELAVAPPQADEERLFERLRFDPEFQLQREPQLAKIEQTIRARTYPAGYDTVFRIEDIGKADFAPFQVSIDGAFHAALHLGFLRCFGRVPEIGNFISLRSVQHGEIHRYNSSTEQMRQFCKAPSQQTLQAALSAHKALVKETKQATEEFYQISMMMFTMFNRRELKLLGSVSLFLLLTLFVKNFRRRFVSQDMWVSHIPEFPGLALTGRPGITMSYLDAPALAGHYMIFDHHVLVCFVSSPGRKTYRGQEQKFVTQLRQSLTEIRQLLAT